MIFYFSLRPELVKPNKPFMKWEKHKCRQPPPSNDRKQQINSHKAREEQIGSRFHSRVTQRAQERYDINTSTVQITPRWEFI